MTARFLLLLPLLLLFSRTAPAQGLRITPLAPNIYIFTTWQTYKGQPVPSNGLYVVTGEGAVLLDMPWDTTQVRPLLDTIRQRHGQDVVMSISTHFHSDRTAANDILKNLGVRTWSSAATLQLCREKGEPQAQYTFSQDTLFRIGHYSFQTFYPGKGHSSDNIVVWIPEEKILYGGCFIKSTDAGNLGNVADASVPEWRHSVLKLMKRYPSPRYIIPGHDRWNSRQALKHTLKLINASLRKS